MASIPHILSNNPHLETGVLIGFTKYGKNAVVAYFILGTDDDARNRVFSLDKNNLKIELFNKKKIGNSSFISHTPIKTLGGSTIINTESQNIDIYKRLREGKSFYDTVKIDCCELLAPYHSPKIFSMLTLTDTSVEYKFSIIKKLISNEFCELNFFEYPHPIAGLGHLICRYNTNDKSKSKTCIFEPKEINIRNNLKNFGDEIWESLNSDNKISLFTRFINVKTGEDTTRIINKYY